MNEFNNTQLEKFKTVNRMIGSHNTSEQDRERHDYYASSPEAAEWLLKIEDINQSVWECACGEGHLSKVFEASGRDVMSTDLIDRGFGTGGVDFLKTSRKWDGDIVTNPPFKDAQKFIEHGLELISNGNKVCVLLKLSFLEGQKRKKLFEDNPPRRVWVSRSRLQFGVNGDFSRASNMMAIAWFIFEKGYKGPTELGWFN